MLYTKVLHLEESLLQNPDISTGGTNRMTPLAGA